MYEILASIAIFKITVMFMEYDGPLDCIKIFRETINRFQTKRKALNFECFFCLSTVVAFPFALAYSGWDILLYWFALSGIALFIDLVYERLL
jgi:hypothetical protein